MGDLKPCPFCGNDVELIDDEITCVQCNCAISDWMAGDEWNTRPIEDQLRAELETARQRAENAEKLWEQEANKLATARQELDRMTGAVKFMHEWAIRHQIAVAGTEEDGQRVADDVTKAAKIREKYGFDKS